MIKCNTQANDKAMTANNWQTPGVSDPGRYSGVIVVDPELIWSTGHKCDAYIHDHCLRYRHNNALFCQLLDSNLFTHRIICLYCHVIFLRVAFYHVIMCISFCIRVRLMHASIFPVVHFAIRHSYALRRPPFASCCERVLNFLGMARGLPSGLGIAPIDRLSSFVPFGGRLVLQRLTG